MRDHDDAGRRDARRTMQGILQAKNTSNLGDCTNPSNVDGVSTKETLDQAVPAYCGRDRQGCTIGVRRVYSVCRSRMLGGIVDCCRWG
jgi:hypothetical protein